MFTLVTADLGIVGRWRAVCVTALQRPNSDAAAIDIVVGIAAASLSVKFPIGAGKRQAPVFDVFEAFLNTDNIQVFANAATDYIMCLMKFVKGLGENDCKEIGDCIPSSASSSTDLCLPALDYLRKCSQLLSKIYKMPMKPIFLCGRLSTLPRRVQERSGSSEDGIDAVLSEFDDDTGLIDVWINLLEQLTAAVSNCPRQHQPPTLDLLFELLREVAKVPAPTHPLERSLNRLDLVRAVRISLASTAAFRKMDSLFAIPDGVRRVLSASKATIARSIRTAILEAYQVKHPGSRRFQCGPGFAIYAVVHLLLPVMSMWLARSQGDHVYWDAASANFKHAIGLSCELVVEHIQSFINSDIGYENMINTMLKELFKLLVSCVAEPTETISRVGCSCIRYVLVTAGPVFTEEMWRLACCALQDAFSATLEPMKNLLGYFHSGSESFSGDACEVKVAAPSLSPNAEAEYWRIRAMTQQRRCSDTDNDPDRCSVAVWSLESCHTDRSPATNDAGNQGKHRDGNQGKHRVTKRGPALSYPMFTLVTSEDIAGSVSHTPIQRCQQKSSDEIKFWTLFSDQRSPSRGLIVFMLDAQCSPKTPNNKEGFEHAQSCVLIIELPPDEKPNGHTQKR
ncbi:unnamed protein product [Ranitomeya imitator]|uniref:Uncharacterized protein n=1 Tax=Ranitomeya imitator TaxID=111125 RepID=A0ABN9KWF4_9NEOB|nr:unnamed protein product [Ranitomeya imitator]